MKPIVVIPALNPDHQLLSLTEKLTEAGFRIIVVNDGSDPQTAAVFEQLKAYPLCDVCTHEKNLGKGSALKTGITYIMQKYPDCPGFITADADGQHSVADIQKIAVALLGNPQAMILGTRSFDGKDVPFRSRFGNRMTSAVFRFSAGRKCADTQTGLRGIGQTHMEACLAISGDRYEYEMNMLLDFARKRIPFMHVPIQTIYIEQNRASHFSPVKDSLRIYLTILKYSLSSIASAAVDLSLFAFLSTFVFPSDPYQVVLSTILARMISGVVNFLLNRQWVFQPLQNSRRQKSQYAALFIFQMLMSWLLVSLLSTLPISLIGAKIAVDTLLFFISYLIQKNYIFTETKKGYLMP